MISSENNVNVQEFPCCSEYCKITGNNWAATWQNQQSDCAPSEDSDQPGHPPSLIRVFPVRLMGSLAFFMRTAKTLIRLGGCSLWSDWADAQADLSLRWAHSHLVGFVMSRLIWRFVHPWQVILHEAKPEVNISCCGRTTRHITLTQQWIVPNSYFKKFLRKNHHHFISVFPGGNIACKGNTAGLTWKNITNQNSKLATEWLTRVILLARVQVQCNLAEYYPAIKILNKLLNINEECFSRFFMIIVIKQKVHMQTAISVISRKRFTNLHRKYTKKTLWACI